MKTDLFDYTLPQSLVAFHPPTNRDGGKLLVAFWKKQTLKHETIAKLPKLLPQNALVIANDSKVIPARLAAKRPSGGAVEVLLVRLERIGDDECTWSTLCKANKPLRLGDTLHLEDKAIATVTRIGEMGHRELQINLPSNEFRQYVNLYGKIPLPPYIRRNTESADHERYQTVFAKHEGSVAAPTAGLHLTDNLIQEIKDTGTQVEFVTLHVGPGTFRPINVETTQAHQMDIEHYNISERTAQKINDAQKTGRPIIAVGTTVVRTLEGCAKQHGGKIVPGAGATDIFIYPPYSFKIINGLLTNFHLPKSTLLCLVSALGGREFVMDAYDTAVKNNYRFYSYGDAMLLLGEHP